VFEGEVCLAVLRDGDFVTEFGFIAMGPKTIRAINHLCFRIVHFHIKGVHDGKGETGVARLPKSNFLSREN